VPLGATSRAHQSAADPVLRLAMNSIDRALNVSIAVAALAMAGVVVRREMAPSIPTIPGANLPPRFVSTWKDLLPHAIPLGDSSGAVKVIEFADFECPFCRRFDSTMHVVVARYPGQVSRYFVHFPLPTLHRFALPAARAAECAGRLGR